MSPNNSSQGNPGRGQFSGEPSHLEDIIEASSNSSKSRPSDSHRSSIRVVGPRPATMPRSESNQSAQRDLRTMWDPSQMGDDDTLEIASSVMAVAPSPNQRKDDERREYIGSIDNLDDTIEHEEDQEQSNQNISPAVRRKGGGSRHIFTASGMRKDENLDDDESEGLLTPQMRSAGKFESQQSNKRR